MPEVGSHEVTRLLAAASGGDPHAADDLLPLIYDELRRLASVRMGAEKPGQTLQATALVHEAYLRLVGEQDWDGRGHFFAAAAEAMRRILVEKARRKARLRHGGGRQRVDIELESVEQEDSSSQIVAVDEALRRLEDEDQRLAEVVKLRFFAGLTEVETARALEISERTVRRDWIFAKAYLADALGKDDL